MKCPKCGSEMMLGTNKNYNCTKCGNDVQYVMNNDLGMPVYEDNNQRYQARLDKVLSKFGVYSKNWKVLRYNNLSVDYNIEEQQFYLHGKNKISLKTVESLLEDLEQ